MLLLNPFDLKVSLKRNHSNKTCSSPGIRSRSVLISKLKKKKSVFIILSQSSENFAHVSLVILDCVFSLDSGFIVANSALHVPLYDPPIVFQFNSRLQKVLHLLAKEILSYLIPCGIQGLLTFYNGSWALISY